MNTFRAITPVAAAVLSMACDTSSGAPQQDLFVRDSAGIEIVENRGVIPEFSLSAEPRLRLGRQDGPPQLQMFRVPDALELDDGSVVVVSQVEPLIRIFAPDGTLRAFFGSSGEGPREFGLPQRVWKAGADSLVIYDWRNRRLAYWTAGGGFLSVSPMRPLPAAPLPGGRFRDGSILVTSLVVTRSDDFTWSPLIGLRYGASGTLQDTVLNVPGWNLGPVDIGGETVLLARHFEGLAGARALEDAIALTLGDMYEVRILDPAGRLMRLVRWAGRERTVTQAHVAAAREEAARSASTDEQRQQALRFFDATPVAERFGTVAGLRAAPAGGFWVEEWRRPGDPEGERWLAFDDEGRLLGRVALAAGARLTRVGREHLIVIEQDELDIEYVSLYPLPPELATSADRPVRAKRNQAPNTARKCRMYGRMREDSPGHPLPQRLLVVTVCAALGACGGTASDTGWTTLRDTLPSGSAARHQSSRRPRCLPPGRWRRNCASVPLKAPARTRSPI